MTREKYNVVPVVLAVLLHSLIFGSVLLALDFSRPAPPATPLAIQATVVAEAPAAQQSAPEPEPEPEPDLEAQRAEAEAERIQREMEAEQDRIRQQQEAERQRREQEAEEQRRREEEAERQRQAREAEERRKREEAERERQRQEAERQRQEEERRRREAEEAEQQRLFQQQLAEEEARMQALGSAEMDAYRFAITQAIERNWVRPASAVPGLECVVLVRQIPGGEVIGANIERCNGDDAVRRSIEAAVYKASPLPQPSNPMLFDRNLRIIFKPEQ